MHYLPLLLPPLHSWLPSYQRRLKGQEDTIAAAGDAGSRARWHTKTAGELEAVETIGNEAFSTNKLTEVELPNSLLSMAPNAFSYQFTPICFRYLGNNPQVAQLCTPACTVSLTFSPTESPIVQPTADPTAQVKADSKKVNEDYVVYFKTGVGLAIIFGVYFLYVKFFASSRKAAASFFLFYRCCCDYGC